MANGFGNISDAFTGFAPGAGLAQGLNTATQGITSVLKDLAVLNIRNKQAQELQQQRVQAQEVLQANQLAARQKISEMQIDAQEKAAAAQAANILGRQREQQSFNADQRKLDRENAKRISEIQKTPRIPTAAERIRTAAEADQFLQTLGIESTAAGNQKLFQRFTQTGDVSEFKPVIDAVEDIQNEAALLFEPEGSKALNAERRKLRKDKELLEEFENLRDLAKSDPISARSRIKAFKARKRSASINRGEGDVNLLASLRGGFLGLVDSLSQPPAAQEGDRVASSVTGAPISGGAVF